MTRHPGPGGPTFRQRRLVRGLLSLASLIAAAGLIGWGMPAVAGVRWSQVLAELAELRAWQLVVLTTLWLAGLWVYTFVLTAALPGLRNWQGFALNATGSAVSNLLPFGGAAGVAVTYTLASGWGFPRRAVIVSTLVTGIWNILIRLTLPAAGTLLLVANHLIPNQRIIAAAAITSTVVLGGAFATVLALRSPAAANRLGTALDTAAQLLPRSWRPRRPGIAVAFQRLQTTTSDLVHRAWPRLTLGTAAYVGLQATLLAGCLGAAGAHLPIAVTLAAFAVNRALTTAIVTPGGVGITETGTLALLLSLGAPPSPATAGVLLFGTFTYALEIPLGGLMWTAVLTSRYHPSRRPTATDRS